MVSAICPRCHIVLVEANAPSQRAWGRPRTPRGRPARGSSPTAGAAEAAAAVGLQPLLQPPRRRDRVRRRGRRLAAPSTRPTCSSSPPSAGPRCGTAVGWAGVDRDRLGQHRPRRHRRDRVGLLAADGQAVLAARARRHRPGGCPNRTENDVAAVANPSTGVAVYDTYRTHGEPGRSSAGPARPTPIITGHLRPGREPGAAHDTTCILRVPAPGPLPRRDLGRERGVPDHEPTSARRAGLRRADRPGHAQRDLRVLPRWHQAGHPGRPGIPRPAVARSAWPSSGSTPGRRSGR